MGAKNFKIIKTTTMIPIIGRNEFIIENIPPEFYDKTIPLKSSKFHREYIPSNKIILIIGPFLACKVTAA